MNHSEYLRRKLQRIPTVIGPARPGDESMRIMEARFKASVRRAPTTPVAETCCRGPTPYWRSGGGRPDAPPYPRVADGQQQEWSSEFIAASKAGCAICSTGRPGYVITPCCPVEPTPEAPLDLSRKALALQGKKTCCPAVGNPVPPIDCSCALRPGHINTLWANDMPSDKIPYPVPIRDCKRCPIFVDCECGGC